MPRLLPHPGGHALESSGECHEKEYGTNEMGGETTINGELDNIEQVTKYDQCKGDLHVYFEAQQMSSVAKNSGYELDYIEK
eukprot:13758829-Alexandrium_andersonii.AAC.1